MCVRVSKSVVFTFDEARVPLEQSYVHFYCGVGAPIVLQQSCEVVAIGDSRVAEVAQRFLHSKSQQSAFHYRRDGNRTIKTLHCTGGGAADDQSHVIQTDLAPRCQHCRQVQRLVRDRSKVEHSTVGISIQKCYLANLLYCHMEDTH